MLKLTEQKAREFVTSKGGVVDKILKENGGHYFYITCKLGHHFKKEKSKLDTCRNGADIQCKSR